METLAYIYIAQTYEEATLKQQQVSKLVQALKLMSIKLRLNRSGLTQR